MATVQKLREAYAKIDRINPESENYKRLCDYLDAQSTAYLEILADAQIKFVSSLARNRVIRRKMKNV